MSLASHTSSDNQDDAEPCFARAPEDGFSLPIFAIIAS